MSFFFPSRFSLRSSGGGRRYAFADVLAHELSKHLCRWAIMDLARRDEFVPQIPVQPDAQPDIFFGHVGSVPNGYTSAREIIPQGTAVRMPVSPVLRVATS
jgi:hypothetical protein